MKIGIIGAGNMGSALAKALVHTSKVIFFDRNYEKALIAAKECKADAVKNIQDLAKSCSWIVLAIKPVDFNLLAETLNSELKTESTICSIMSGISLSTLKEKLPSHTVYRTMPNLAVAYGTGILGIVEDNLSLDQKNECEKLFSKVGLIEWISERKMDAFISLAGSGPAFACVLVESMVEAGIAMGFSSTQSLKIVIQMLKGSLCMLEASNKHPAELKWAIASPGGTTIAGLKALEHSRVRDGLMETFLQTYKRSQELSQ